MKKRSLLGPGLITGASDDDPAGIGTYAVAGAQLGFSTLWTAVVTFPLMMAVQSISAQIAMVSGKGLAGVIRDRCPRVLLYGVVALLFAANTFNVGADLGGMTDALRMLFPANKAALVLLMASAILLLQILGTYGVIARIFKWLTLALLAYVADMFMVHPDWREVLRGTILPSLTLDGRHVTTLLAILGTTLSPYLFFWQASEEVEEEVEEGRTTLKSRRNATRAELSRSRLDVAVGMGISCLVMYCIMLTTAAALHLHGTTNIQSAVEAARALEPLAGSGASWLFAAGMIGAGFLAVPVLSGSAGYAICEAFRWPCGLNLRFRQARKFYLIIVISTVLGVAFNFFGINPIKALYWSAVLNGLAAPPVLAVILKLARDPNVMGKQILSAPFTVLGWVAAGMMALAGLFIFF